MKNDDYLEDIIMPFGKYAGEYVVDITLNYLEWLHDNIQIKGDLLEAVKQAIDYHYSK